MKSDEKNAIQIIEKSFYLRDQRKHLTFKTPDIQKMQEVIIDQRTKIYIAIDADPEKARSRYFNRLEATSKLHMASRKPVAT